MKRKDEHKAAPIGPEQDKVQVYLQTFNYGETDANGDTIEPGAIADRDLKPVNLLDELSRKWGWLSLSPQPTKLSPAEAEALLSCVEAAAPDDEDFRARMGAAINRVSTAPVWPRPAHVVIVDDPHESKALTPEEIAP